MVSRPRPYAAGLPPGLVQAAPDAAALVSQDPEEGFGLLSGMRAFRSPAAIAVTHSAPTAEP